MIICVLLIILNWDMEQNCPPQYKQNNKENTNSQSSIYQQQAVPGVTAKLSNPEICT